MVVGFAAIIIGGVMFVIVLQQGGIATGQDTATTRIAAFTWLLGGIACGVLPLGLAEVLMKLDELRARALTLCCHP